MILMNYEKKGLCARLREQLVYIQRRGITKSKSTNIIDLARYRAVQSCGNIASKFVARNVHSPEHDFFSDVQQ
jgi:hypothetical protein